MSEATNRATANYRKKNVKQITIRFYPSEAETYEYAKAQGPSKIKELIEKDRVK